MSIFKFNPGTKNTLGRLVPSAQVDDVGNELGGTGLDILQYPEDLLSDFNYNGTNRTTFAMGFYIHVPTSSRAINDGSTVLSQDQSNEVNKVNGLQYADEVNKQLSVAAGREVVSDALAGEQRIRIFRQSRTLKKMIVLFMPETLNNDLQAQYNQMDIGGTTTALLTSGVDAFKSLSSKDGLKGTDIERILTNVIGATNLLGVGKLVQQGVGRAVNPLSEVLFENMGFRSFNFDFKFVPKTEKEARDIQEIVRTFRTYMVPELNQDAVAGAFFSVPAFFSIKFFMLKDGVLQENPNLQKISGCALEGLLLDHAPDGFAMHIDGAPVATRMQLQFRELEIMHRDKITKGY